METRYHLKLTTMVCLGVLLLSTPSEGLTYEELVLGGIDVVTKQRGNPVIPHSVQAAGNVNITTIENGLLSFVFKSLPHHDTKKVTQNAAVSQQEFHEVHLPEDPVPQDNETCITEGPIGWTIHGVALFTPFHKHDAMGRDHAGRFNNYEDILTLFADSNGTYQYHDDALYLGVLGIARDGFPIYGPHKEDGAPILESELDKCHSRCGTDGKYRYHMTDTYPYILGCFRGSPGELRISNQREPALQRPGRRPTRNVKELTSQCLYTTIVGENYEFKRCTACSQSIQQRNSEDNFAGQQRKPDGNASQQSKPEDNDTGYRYRISFILAMVLIPTACLLLVWWIYFHRAICTNTETYTTTFTSVYPYPPLHHH